MSLVFKILLSEESEEIAFRTEISREICNAPLTCNYFYGSGNIRVSVENSLSIQMKIDK
tara:strand:+ start:426 stop:602 length:177 start_codon:yes stop_codon:yes gene_type:complete